MDHSPCPDESPTETTRLRAGNLFTDADPDVILAMTADILACLGDFARLYPEGDMPSESVRGLGYILSLAEQGVSLAHDSVLKLQERQAETPGAPTACTGFPEDRA